MSLVSESDSNKLEKLQQAFDTGHWNEALDLAQSLVSEGHLELLSLIAYIYDVGGSGVNKNRDEARNWYERAIYETDDFKGHVGLATYYFDKALETPVAWEKFERHALAALNAGEKKFMLLIAFALDSGRFNFRDPKQAKTYYELAASAGFLFAHLRLANLRLYSGDLSALINLLKIIKEICAIAIKNKNDPRLFLLKKHWGMRTNLSRDG